MTIRIALWIAGVTVVSACGDPAGASQKVGNGDPLPVRAAQVVEEAVSLPVVATGTLGPKEEIALSFKIGGVIERISVDAGETVRAGETLAALDLREIEAAVARAQSAAEKAERDLARAGRLHTDSVVTLAQLQDAQTAAEMARADLEAARFNRRYAVITAPASGVILRRRAEPGETVAPGSTILVLGSRARGSVVRVGLADRDVVRVRHGEPAIARFDAIPDRTFEGRVSEIAAAAEPGTGTYAVEVALPDAGALAAGLVGQVEIRPTARSRAVIVPIEAMLEADGDAATVFALSPDGAHAERRRVTVAFITGDRVAVSAGLADVDAVLIEGAAYLDDGSAVSVLP